MIDLYIWGTPNGRKVSVLLEELGLPYKVHPVDLSKKEQMTPDYLKISPYHKIPAIVDNDGPGGKPLALCESAAIMIYLAEKTKSPLLPTDPAKRAGVLQWTMFNAAGMGPASNGINQFVHVMKEDVPQAKKYFLGNMREAYVQMEARLGQSAHLGCDTYSLADVGVVPFVFRHERHGIDLAEFPKVKAWYDKVMARPAVKRGMEVPQP
jgi:GST-like protein